MFSSLFKLCVDFFRSNDNMFTNKNPTPEERLVYFGQYPKRISIHNLTIWKKDVQKHLTANAIFVYRSFG